MASLERRIEQLEAREGISAQQTVLNLSDAQLRRIIVVSLTASTDEEIEAELAAHPEFRELFEELMPEAREQRRAHEAFLKTWNLPRHDSEIPHQST